MEQSVLIEKYAQYVIKGINYDFNNQVVYRFENGYGASVINGKGSYGLESLRIYFPYPDSDDYIISDNQHINLTKKELEKILNDIKALT